MEEPVTVECPWCWEHFITFFDYSVGGQSYVEDCQVCCRPIMMHFKVGRSGEIKVQTQRD